jgi:dissimilatory sulfite reductase (desulfoviridin) alpha/beta subunit
MKIWKMHDGWGGGEITFVYVESDIIRRSSLQMINAIQEALAPVGQTRGTTAPTVSAM